MTCESEVAIAETYDSDGVTRGEGEDVGAGDDAGASGLELGLDGVDDVVATEALVERRVLLRRVVGSRVQKDRPVATLGGARTVNSLVLRTRLFYLAVAGLICIRSVVRLTYSEQAVDGEEPEEWSGEVWRLGEDGGHLLEHDLLRLGARLVVRPEVRVGLRRRRPATQDNQSNHIDGGKS